MYASGNQNYFITGSLFFFHTQKHASELIYVEKRSFVFLRTCISCWETRRVTFESPVIENGDRCYSVLCQNYLLIKMPIIIITIKQAD